MILESVCQLAKDAGEAIMAIYHQPSQINIQTKEDHSPVTAADLAAHQVIVAGLNRLTPDIPVLSEEAVCSWQDRQNWLTYWLVDPLDGTKEFIQRNGEFTVNIALISQGKPILGVIYVPVTGVLYFAENNQAWKEHANTRLPLAVQHCEKPTVAMTRSHASQQLYDYLQQLPNHDEVVVGSSLKFCLLAEGLAQIYPRFGPTSIWDTAAGHAILDAAGGVVVDFYGNPLTYEPRQSLINPDFLATLPQCVDQYLKK